MTASKTRDTRGWAEDLYTSSNSSLGTRTVYNASFLPVFKFFCSINDLNLNLCVFFLTFIVCLHVCGDHLWQGSFSA